MNVESDSQVSSAGPTTLGDYALIRRIGAGAHGDVWLATDAVGKHVAIKIIDRERLALITGKNREERAIRLMRTQLPEHPHLIRVHHVGNDATRLYYVMDLADDIHAASHAPGAAGPLMEKYTNTPSCTATLSRPTSLPGAGTDRARQSARAAPAERLGGRSGPRLR